MYVANLLDCNYQFSLQCNFPVYKIQAYMHVVNLTAFLTLPAAKTQFQVLKKAYDLLSDPKRRNLYDRTGKMFQYARTNAQEHPFQLKFNKIII